MTHAVPSQNITPGGVGSDPISTPSLWQKVAEKISHYLCDNLGGGSGTACVTGIKFGLITGTIGIAAYLLICTVAGIGLGTALGTASVACIKFGLIAGAIGIAAYLLICTVAGIAAVLIGGDSQPSAALPPPPQNETPRRDVPQEHSAKPLGTKSWSSKENLDVYRATAAYGLRHYSKQIQNMKTHCNPCTSQPTVNEENRNRHTTVTYVANLSTLRMTQDLVKRSLKPLVLDMANAFEAGGGVLRGANAQEEIVCRQSTLMHGLLHLNNTLGNQAYPIPETGGLHVPEVVFFRADPNDHYKYLEGDTFQAGVYAMAAYVCIADGNYKGARPADDKVYLENTKEKIRNYFRTAVVNGYDSIVASAFGCGAFSNEPNTIATWFRDVLNEDEFQGVFKEVAFGIIEDSASGGKNFTTFRDILGERLPSQ